MIIKKFEDQVEKFPGNPAVITENKQLTYAELDNYANGVAYEILAYDRGRKKKAEPSVVGLLFQHGADMVAAVIAALKAGKVYVPLDVSYPGNRLAYMLNDSESYLVLTNNLHVSLAEELAGKVRTGLKILNIDTIDIDSSVPGKPLEREPSGRQLAYILYTSGSTGKPRGVGQNHENVCYYIRNWTERFSISCSDRMTLFSAFSHDGAVQDMFGALHNGAALYPYNILTRSSITQLHQWLLDEKITLWHSVPTLYRYFTDTLQDRSTKGADILHFSHLRFILLGGEPLREHDIEMFKRFFPGSRLANIYGQTESSVNSTWIINPEDSINNMLIGEPLDKTKILITADNGRVLQNLGVGEIVVACQHLAPGYWKDKEQTGQRFHLSRKWGRVYYTGDLGRLMADGSIEFRGRKDSQVKIRGFRIEVGEIETVLLSHEAIKEAAVISRTDGQGNDHLYAYFVPEISVPGPGNELTFSVSQLRAYLSRQLPEHMIPSYFVRLKQLPLTPNGKLDRKKLPAAKPLQAQPGLTYVIPKTDVEKKVVEIWKQVLKLEQVGINDNFFDLGGTSLDILNILGKLYGEFKKNIPLVSIFRYPTVQSFSRYLTGEETGEPGEPAAAAMPTGGSRAEPYQPIAVIGMSCRFPGSRNIDEFWENLKNGAASVTFFLNQELETAGVDLQLLDDPNYVKAKSVLEEVEYFDAAFFNYSPAEAEIMDPQLRILHECSWQALENAGYASDSYEGAVGIYTGNSPNQYWFTLVYLNNKNRLDALFMNNNYSTKISYKLNLHGPSIVVQTACSTSLVAIHMAAQGLINRECDIALAGGVCVSLPGKAGYLYREDMILSPDGQCRAFDAKAGGTVFGDGCGMVVLKPLANALADGDTINAVIKSSAVNNDGKRKPGITAPSVEGQAEVIKHALQLAAVEPECIGYIETHGTGTILGDPVEMEALKLAFNTDKKGYCPIGSVKSNFGHLNAAAGVAGFIKTVLVLKHRMIPPLIHFEHPNPKIDFENSPFYVNTSLAQWKNGNYPLCAGVSSFGVGGTNAHIILEEAPAKNRDNEGTRGLAPLFNRQYQLILLSAKTETALDKMTENLAEFFKKNLLNRDNHENPINPGLTLANAAYSLQVGRKAFEYRRVLLCSRVQEAIELVKAITLPAPGKTAGGKVYTGIAREVKQPVIFMFPGQGSQYVNMGLGLYQTEPVFREEMDRCFEILKSLMGYDIKEIIYPHPGCRGGSPCPPQDGDWSPGQGDHGESPLQSDQINQTEIAQPLIFAIEYALAKLLMKWGIKPDAMIGHSIGEYTAAHLAGVFSLEDGLTLVVLRGKLMQQMPPGSMLSVPLPEEELSPWLENHEEISLAAVNGTSACVVSGIREAINAVEKELKIMGIETTRVHTSHAFHSRLMNPILEEFASHIGTTTLNPPKLPYISNLTGNWITVEESTDPGYWARHLRRTVRFADGIKELLKEENAIFVEIGPGRALSSLLRKECKKRTPHQVLNLMRHPNENVKDYYYLLDRLAQLWIQGIKIDWRGFYYCQRGRRTALPVYPFEGQPFWLDESRAQDYAQVLPTTAQISKKPDIADWFYIPAWIDSALEPGTDVEEKNRGPWLLFIDDQGLGTRLARQLKREKNQTPVVLVKPGPRFARSGKSTYIINPGQSADYDALFKDLGASVGIPSHIVHLWNVLPTDPGDLTSGGIEKIQDLGFYSLLEIVRTLGKQEITSNIRLDVVTDNMQKVTGEDMVCPVKAAILGPVQVIPREYPNIRCRSLDVILPKPGSPGYQQLIGQLLTEFNTPGSHKVIAFRGSHRLVLTYEPRRLEKSPGVKKRFPGKGVYLITGGLGGIGYVVAHHLVKNVPARLILVGRSHIPSRNEWEKWLASHDENDRVSQKIRKVLELEKPGGEVTVVCGDVSDPKQMEELINSIKKKFGTLTGVFHCAGTADYAGVIQERTREKSREILSSKVNGTLVLHNLVKDMKLAFFMLCSSISALFGTFGQVAYCAANAFLDAFALSRSPVDETKTLYVSINWDAWQQIGMTADSARRLVGQRYESHLKNLLQNGILPEEGIEVCERVLNQSLHQVVVSTGDLNMKSRQQEHFPVIKPTYRLNKRPGLKTQYAAPATKIEKILTEIWQEHLGFDKIGIHDNFFELGANSLDILQVNTRLKEIFNKEIPLVTMYTYSTIQALKEYLPREEQGIHFSRDETQRLEAKGKQEKKEIALIGMSGRFPGANTIEEFWQNLKNGVESLSFFSAEELEQAGVEPRWINQANYVKTKSIIEKIEDFDAYFFGYKPGEARAMDPQVRIFQECLWEAFETAGYDPLSYKKSIGLYAGASDSTIWRTNIIMSGAAYSELLLSNKDILCTQSSYKFNLKGPSFSLQTACSTSLLAVHLACRGLMNNECHMAAAGGVSLTFPVKSGYRYEDGMIYSHSGHIRAFDSAADGTVFGNGAGVVVLKPLAEALQDGDNVLAVIKGTAINNDGERKVGFTAPSTKGQAEVIRAALQDANVGPETITYIEAHGTGTHVGDPIEIEALKLAFNSGKKQFCGIGSVKTNIGHLDAAAGISGFIKAVLALNHQLIPASLHFTTPNPAVDFENSPFYVVTRPTEWKRTQYPLRAGISSFGFGGTNVHIILEEAPVKNRDNEGTRGLAPLFNRQYHLILLSAKTQSALDKMTVNLAEYLKKNLLYRGNPGNPTNPGLTLTDVAYTLQVGRHAFMRRMMLVCPSLEEAIEALSSPASPGICSSVVEAEGDTDQVITNPGEYPLQQLGQWWLEGKTIDWQQSWSKQKRQRLALPTYPFERQRYWPENIPFFASREMVSFNPPVQEKTGISNWYYIPYWRRSPLPLRSPGLEKFPGCCLVFTDRCGIGTLLQKRLEQQGAHVVMVQEGRAFSRKPPSSSANAVYTIAPGQDSGYKLLIEDLTAQDLIPQVIVHLWNVTTKEPGELDPQYAVKAQDTGFYSLLALARAIGKQDIRDTIQITVVSNNMQDVIGEPLLAPYKALVQGPVKTIPKEYPHLSCRSIDIVKPAPGSAAEEEIIEQLTAEINANTPEPIIAYRNHLRWVRSFQPLRPDLTEKPMTRLREQGVYLITGGLGGIGLELAEYLACQVKAKLVLISRTVFPNPGDWNQWLLHHDAADHTSKKIEKIQQLETWGAEVLVLAADVSHRARLEEACKKAEQKFGKINGVIHSAGIPDAGLIQAQTRGTAANVLAPKVTGTIILADILKNRQLDFFILCSSIASILAPGGQVAYTSANAFLDAFASYKTAKVGPVITSINWDAWQEVGMSVNIGKQFAGIMDTSLEHGILPREGREVFASILAEQFPQVVISTRNLDRVMEAFRPASITGSLGLREPGADSASTPRELKNRGIPSREKIEKQMIEIWKNLLGIENVDRDDNFFDLGATSIDIVQVNGKLKELLGRDLAVVTLYNHPTVAELVGYLYPESGSDEPQHEQDLQLKAISKAKNRLKRKVTQRERKKDE